MRRLLTLTIHAAIASALVSVFIMGAVELFKQDKYARCVQRTMPYYYDTVRCHAEIFGKD